MAHRDTGDAVAVVETLIGSQQGTRVAYRPVEKPPKMRESQQALASATYIEGRYNTVAFVFVRGTGAHRLV